MSGSITTSGIEGIAAHSHQGAAGQSGPPIITLIKGENGLWPVPGGNVHSAEHKP